MGLVDLKTNLKSLKYGEETPLITKDINNPPSNNTFAMEVDHRVDDTIRIVKLIASKPGISWAAKQAALEILQQSLNTDGKEKLLKKLAAAGINTAKIIASTVAQVPVSGTGTHFVRGFAGEKGYVSKNGAPLTKQGEYVYTTDVETNHKLPGGQLVSTAGVASSPISQDFISNYIMSSETIPQTPVQDEDDDGLVELNPDTPAVPKVLGLGTVLTHSSKVRKETRVGLGEQGSRKNRVNYSDISEDLSDKINIFEPVQGATDEDVAKDLIKFNFQIVTPQSNGKVKKNTLYFRAHLDSFSDNYTGNWSGHKYIGRAENFYTYSGFERGISLSFKIAAATRQEMKPLYQKIVTLASATAPTYQGAGFMKGTIVGLTVGDYLDRTYGVLNSVNYSWQTEYPWEITLDKEKDSDMQQLPMILDCSVNFTPIHNFVPQTGQYHYITKESGDFLNPLMNE